MKEYLSFEKQRQLHTFVYDSISKNINTIFDKEGNCIVPSGNIGLRDTFRYISLLLSSGRSENILLANKMILKQEMKFCHFTPFIILTILCDNRKSFLEENAYKKLFAYIENVIDDFKRRDMDFIGVNDNFPFMSTCIMLCAAKLLNDDSCHQIALRRLHQAEKLLKRRGAMSEYNSITYSMVQLHAISKIAAVAPNNEIKTVALNIEERVWADVLSHYHPNLSRIAGPHSRAYMNDSCGYHCFFDTLMDYLFDEKRRFDDEERNILDIAAAYYADTIYHIPTYLLDLGFSKKFPYEVRESSEFSSSTDSTPDEPTRDPSKEDDIYEYPAGINQSVTYMTDDYALGTSVKEFHSGNQTAGFKIIYRKNKAPTSMKDMGSAFCCYALNEHAPVYPIPYSDHGRKLCFQHKNTAMVIYKPKAGRVDCIKNAFDKELSKPYKIQEITGNLSVSRMRLDIILPCKYKTPDEIWLGEKKVENYEAESKEVCDVWIKDGNIYMGFHPLHVTDLGRKCAIKVWKNDKFVIISLINYEGEKRNFSKREFLLVRNGFLSEIISSEEVESFEDFRHVYGEYQIEDILECSVHSRQTYYRNVSYTRGDVCLECQYSPISEGVKYVSVNGRAYQENKLKINGFDENILPYMDK